MPTMSYYNAALAAGGQVDNAFVGDLHEFLGGAAALSFSVVGAAAGITATVIVGGRTLLDDMPASGINRYPINPDDFVLTGEAGLPGERVILRIRNTTAGALAVWGICGIAYL